MSIAYTDLNWRVTYVFDINMHDITHNFPGVFG